MSNYNGNAPGPGGGPVGKRHLKVKHTPELNVSAEQWMEHAIQTALGFRVARVALRSYQVQFLDKRGRVTRVRPATNEEVLMYRTLVMPATNAPLPNGDGGE